MDIKERFNTEKGMWEISLEGEIDIYNAPALKEALLKLIDANKSNMQIDCINLKYIDSTGLGVLISTLKRVKDFNGSIRIINLKPYIYKIFTITGLNKIFDLEVQE